MPFIWECNRIAMEFAYREEYPNVGSWIDQPMWFNQLYTVARNEIIKLRNKKMEKK